MDRSSYRYEPERHRDEALRSRLTELARQSHRPLFFQMQPEP